MNTLIIGGLSGFITALFVNFIMPVIMRYCRTKNLSIEFHNKNYDHVHCRVINKGSAPIKNAILYISLYIPKGDPDNVIRNPPEGYKSILNPGHFNGLVEDRLCWSVRRPDKNPLAVDIYGKEAQVFSLCEIGGCMIIIPSEDGWPEKDIEECKDRKYRICLAKKEYTGKIKMVSENANAIEYSIHIKPDDIKYPIKLYPLQKNKLVTHPIIQNIRQKLCKFFCELF